MSTVLLHVINIKKQYFEKGKVIKTALNGVSFDIHKGEIISILGVNGAGKTTLSSILATLHPATSGDIMWYQAEGRSSIFDTVANYRKIVGFCPQKPNLDNELTLEENLIFAGRYYGMSPQAIIHKKDELVRKFDLLEYVNQKASVLSGGYKQRFLIARTLMHSPKLVILDEPTVGLDPQIRHQLWRVIADLKKDGITVLLTTHYMDEAEELSDRVCIINAGTLVAIDTPQRLKAVHQQNNLEGVFLKLTHIGQLPDDMNVRKESL